MATKKSSAKPAEAYHHGDLRKALISAAMTQIDKAGPHEVSLAALARDLGVSQSAPYRHFSDKDKLLAAVATEGFRMFVLALRKSIQGLSGKQALFAMGKAYVEFGRARPGLYNLMFASGIVANASENDDVKLIARESFSVLEEAIPASRNRQLKALGIWSGLHGTVMLERENLIRGEYFNVTLDRLLEQIVD